jgi:hypothetical protein
MSSFKKLNKADVTTTDYRANKRWNINYIATPNDSYIVGSIGKNEGFSITGATTTNGQYKSSIYSSMNHLFYQSYTASLNTGSLMFDVNTYISASQQRPTASYFDYNSNPLLIQQFPTGANETIGVLSINQSIFGSKVLPTSFRISSSGLDIRDDGYGNLYDIAGAEDDYVDLSYLTIAYSANNGYFDDATPGVGIQFIGNIFYAHGIAVITNQSSSYQNFYTGSLSSTASISFQNEHIIYENEVRCIIKESDYNLSYNPTLVTGSYASGSLRDFATGSNFYPYATTIGLYNDDNELLMVAKLGKPIMMSPNTDMTFIVKYDT